MFSGVPELLIEILDFTRFSDARNTFSYTIFYCFMNYALAHRDGAPPCASCLTQGGGASCSAAPTLSAPRRCTPLGCDCLFDHRIARAALGDGDLVDAIALLRL